MITIKFMSNYSDRPKKDFILKGDYYRVNSSGAFLSIEEYVRGNEWRWKTRYIFPFTVIKSVEVD